MLDIEKATKGLTNEEIRKYVNQTTMEFFRRTTMATYTGKQSILDGALGGFKDYGFRLIEPDDHLLELYFKDKRIAVYNQHMATIEIIREGCHNYLMNTSKYDMDGIAKKLQQDYEAAYSEELKKNENHHWDE